MSNTLEFLRFPPLGLIDKLRLGWTILHASRIRRLASRSSRFRSPTGCCRHRASGRSKDLAAAAQGQARRRLAADSRRVHLGDDPADVRRPPHRPEEGNVRLRARRLCAAAGSALSERLAAARRRDSHRLPRGSESTRQADGKLQVTRTTASRLAFDRVVVTTPAPVAARLCPQLATDETSRLEAVEYLGIVCASLLLQEAAGAAITSRTSPTLAPFTGVIEMTALVDPAEFGGRALVYLPKYADSGRPGLSLAPTTKFASIPRRAGPDVSAIFAATTCWPSASRACSTSSPSDARLQPPRAADRNVAAGLFVVNSAQIVNGTLNVNETVRLAEESLDTLCQPLSPYVLQLCRHTHAAADRELVARP